MSSLTLALGTTAVAYVYPLYATYKALVGTAHIAIPAAQNEGPVEKPTELSELETWTMYWCVVSLFWAIDTWLGWTFRWCVCVSHRQGDVVFACQVPVCLLARTATNTRMCWT